MDNIKKAIEEAKCTVALDENDEMVTLDEPRYYFTKDGLFTLFEMISKKVCKDTLLDNSEDGELFEDGFEADWVDYWNETLKALKE